MQKIIGVDLESDPPLHRGARVLGHPPVLLQLDEPHHIEVMPLYELSLPGEEEPHKEVLVGGVPRGEHEVGVANHDPRGGGEEGNGLHHVPRELPEGEAEKEPDLHDG